MPQTQQQAQMESLVLSPHVTKPKLHTDLTEVSASQGKQVHLEFSDQHL